MEANGSLKGYFIISVIFFPFLSVYDTHSLVEVKHDRVLEQSETDILGVI